MVVEIDQALVLDVLLLLAGSLLVASAHTASRWRFVLGEAKLLVKFLKEHGTKDQWEVVRLAKNPSGAKSRMKRLKDLDGNVIEEEDRAEALEKAHFLWQDREIEEEEEDSREDAPGLGREELKDKVLDALSRTSNTSAPGPDGISYKIIKWANRSVLGEYLIDDVVDNLMEGKIPKEWENSKVVFIPKPNRDLALLKAWRPITLINCLGKLGEKVVADKLQQAGLLHRHQFGSVKGKSAIDAVFREVTRVQQYLSAGGKAGWGLWDIKGGFQNIKKDMVLRKLQETKDGKRWSG